VLYGQQCGWEEEMKDFNYLNSSVGLGTSDYRPASAAIDSKPFVRGLGITVKRKVISVIGFDFQKPISSWPRSSQAIWLRVL